MSIVRVDFVEHDNPVNLACGGGMPWRILCQRDGNEHLTGSCWIRTPDRSVIEGNLNDYRQLRAIVPREIYMALRTLKKSYLAEQAGQEGNA